MDDCSFVPYPYERIPPPVLRELRQIFTDLDANDRGYITLSEVYLGLRVNRVTLGLPGEEALTYAHSSNPDALHSDIHPHVRAVARAFDPDADDCVHFLDFATTLHALSVQHREVLAERRYAVFPDSDFTEATATTSLKLRRIIWTLFDDPSSSPLAALIAYTLIAAILLSTCAFIAESHPPTRAGNERAFDGIELSSVLLFTLEYAIRLGCTPEPCKFFISGLNIIDLASIAPFYLELLFSSLAGTGSGGRLLRSLRLLRVVRLAKIGRYALWMKVFIRTLVLSAPPLAMLAFITLTAIITHSSIMYFLERGEWDTQRGEWVSDAAPSQFNSIPAVMWWTVVSMTGVGFGDVAPITLAGRCAAVFVIFSGITLLAIPISIVTGNLHAEYSRMDKMRKLRAEHAAQAAAAAQTPVDVARVDSVREGGKRLHADKGMIHEARRGSAPELATLPLPEHSVRHGTQLEAAWSAPFLTSAMQIVRGNRRRLMSSLKSLELRNRESAVRDAKEFVSDMTNADRMSVLVQGAERAGLA